MEKYHHASQVEIVYEQNARQLSTAYEPPLPSTAIPNAFASARRRRRRRRSSST
jgi:hypothetical protein